MTKYLTNKPFSSPANSKAYVEGWERVFGDGSKCIECGKRGIGDTWQEGEVCLFGTLYACSMACAESHAQREAADGYKPGQPGFWCMTGPNVP